MGDIRAIAWASVVVCGGGGGFVVIISTVLLSLPLARSC